MLFIFVGDFIIIPSFASSSSSLSKEYDYSILKSESIYFVITFSLFFIELIFNGLSVRFDQYPATSALLMLYLLIIWPIVFNGGMEWPYSFLDTSSAI